MNKEKLLLVGAGGFGRVTLEHAERDFKCAFVDDGVPTGTSICGVPVIGTINDLGSLFAQYNKLVVTIGNNSLRERIYKLAEGIGYDFPSIIACSAYISPYASVGKGCIILNNTTVQNGSIVGEGTILNPGVEVHHDSLIGNYVLIYTNSVVRSLAKVGDRAHIGSTLTISNGVVIEPDQIVGNGHSVLG